MTSWTRNASTPCYWLDDHGAVAVPVWRWNVGLWLKARHDDDLDESPLTRSTAISYGSGAPTVCVFQCFIWFPDYEHFGFQGLRRRGRPLISFQGRLGTNPDIRPSPLIPPPRGGAASNRTGVVKRTRDRREQRGWTIYPLSGVGLPLSPKQIKGRGRGWKIHT